MKTQSDLRTAPVSHFTGQSMAALERRMLDIVRDFESMRLQHLLLAASASADLPLNSGGALLAMSLQLQDELECLA